ncbi:MAG: hypothetical protein QM473_10045 [Acidobacteriota bacterium]|nr:hypothetical protein [Acidobacteriota bacterium]
MARRIPLNVQFDPELVKALEAFVASRPGENRSSIVRKAVDQYLRRRKSRQDNQELDALDVEMACEAKRRMEDAEDEVIPYGKARANLGLS